MGKPAGVPVLTCTHTCDGSVPMSMGTGLVTGTKLDTCTHTHGGFYLRVCPLGARLVRVKVHEQAHIRADPYNEEQQPHDNHAIMSLSCLQECAWHKRHNGIL